MSEEYALKTINGVRYVIHIETGCTIPKNKFRMSHEDYYQNRPSFKRIYFFDYYMMSRAKRKSRIKQMKSSIDYRSNYDTLKMHQAVPTDSFKVSLVSRTISDCGAVIDSAQWASLAPLADHPPSCTKQEIKKGKPMRDYDLCEFEDSSSKLSPEKQYLLSRLSSASYTVKGKASEAFNIGYAPFPKDFEELDAWLKAGRYELTPPKEKDGSPRMKTGVEGYAYLNRTFKFTDPDKKEDQVGYEKALVDIDAASTATEDIITVKDADAGLKALQDFEAKKFW